MVIEKHDNILWADIFWDDLSPITKSELLELMGDNGNYDVTPLVSINVSSEEGAEAPHITVKRKVSEWLEGRIDGLKFYAKVYDFGSQFGINKGRVSKLTVVGLNGDIISFDRGWDKKPHTQQTEKSAVTENPTLPLAS
ncbi:MAG: hypothetical protein LBC82_03960 [Oscillospiraceae bacterium]|jgi:hypothetical protein|nr:hypothetical protein [Oscillospiraceae bacterium]